MGRLEEKRERGRVSTGPGTGEGDALDAAFEALAAAAAGSGTAGRRPPLGDAQFESLLLRFKSLDTSADPGQGSVSGPSGGRFDSTVAAGLARVAEELERLHRRLVPAGTDGRPLGSQDLVDEIARLCVNLRIYLMRTQPEAVLVAEAGGWRFALPLAEVEEVRPAGERPEGLVELDPRAWWAGGVAQAAADGRYWIVAVAGARRAAIVVDALHGVCVARVSPPGPMLAGARALAGVVRDALGCPAMLVRLEEVMNAAEA